jgi:hypothetical protein
MRGRSHQCYQSGFLSVVDGQVVGQVVGHVVRVGRRGNGANRTNHFATLLAVLRTTQKSSEASRVVEQTFCSFFL